MKDTTYLYNAYNPRYDENWVYKSDSPLTRGIWINDRGDMVQIKEAYHPTNTIEYTIYPELSLLIIVLLALFMLVGWLIKKWHKAYTGKGKGY